MKICIKLVFNLNFMNLVFLFSFLKDEPLEIYEFNWFKN